MAGLPFDERAAILLKAAELLSGPWRARLVAAGNFYFNDKPTGAAVGRQPFGSARVGRER